MAPVILRLRCNLDEGGDLPSAGFDHVISVPCSPDLFFHLEVYTDTGSVSRSIGLRSRSIIHFEAIQGRWCKARTPFGIGVYVSPLDRCGPVREEEGDGDVVRSLLSINRIFLVLVSSW